MTTSKRKVYWYTLDLAERGMFACHVADKRGHTVWQVRCESEEDYAEWEDIPVPWRDSYRDKTTNREMLALADYLREIGVIRDNSVLVKDE